MHVLVTGGAGFIGSHLVDFHLARGDKVHVVDDLSTGSRRNLRHHRGNPALHFVAADILVWEGLTEACAWADWIYHLAAVVGVFRVLKEPTRVLAVNIAGTERLLRAVEAGGWRPRVLVASTSEVYGPQEGRRLEEEAELHFRSGSGGRWNYAVSKFAAEATAVSYARQFGLPITAVRLFNTIGPRQRGRYGMVVPRFVRQAVAGEPITVFGDGSQTRCFCDVRDTVRALAALLAEPSAVGRVFNVGSQREVSILELAELVRRTSNSSSELRFVPYTEAYGQEFDDIRERRPDLTRLRDLIGFETSHRLETTLDELIAEASSRGKGEVAAGSA